MLGRTGLKHELRTVINDLPNGETIESKRLALEPWRLQFLKSAFSKKPYLLTNERYYQSMLLCGDELNPVRIEPRLIACSTKDDYDTYDYLRMWSSFPTSDRPGRRMKFLIRDAGHGWPVMGICCLSSAIRQLRARDEWVGWQGRSFRAVRAKNLSLIMDISTCIGIPPYSYLTSGKLLCYMMLSNEVRNLYKSRYFARVSKLRKRILTDFVLLVATGAFGENTPQYKGVRVMGQNQFRFIGNTTGYSTFHVPDELYRRIKDFLYEADALHRTTVVGGANAKLRTLRLAARELGVDEERLVFTGHQRAIYAAAVATNWRDVLQGARTRITYCDFPLDRLIDEWKARWLSRRVVNRRVMDLVRRFDPQKFRMSEILN